jgi:hypothetical protein
MKSRKYQSAFTDPKRKLPSKLSSSKLRKELTVLTLEWLYAMWLFKLNLCLTYRSLQN